MVLNSNRKNVAKFKAAYCSVCLLLSPSYQLNDVGDVSLVMENVRDGLKSNIISCSQIKEKFLQGLTNAKKFVSRPFVSANDQHCKNNSTGNHTETSKISWIKKLTTPITDIFWKLWYLTDDRNVTKGFLHSLRHLRSECAKMIDETTSNFKRRMLTGELNLYDNLYYCVLRSYTKSAMTTEKYDTAVAHLRETSSKIITIDQTNSRHWEITIMTLLSDTKQLNSMDKELLENAVRLTAKYGEPGLLEALLNGITQRIEISYMHENQEVNSLLMHVLKEIQLSQTHNGIVPYRLIQNARVVLRKRGCEEDIKNFVLKQFDTYYLKDVPDLQKKDLYQDMYQVYLFNSPL